MDELDRGCEAIAAFDPQALVVSLGFDTHREDPIAVLGLYSEDFGRVAERIASLGVTAAARAGGRIRAGPAG